MKTTIQLLAIASLSVLAACASTSDSMSSAPAVAKDGVFVDAKGMTLYTFDKDAPAPGKSTCNGQCATNWPPLMAKPTDKASGDWTIITRDDGSKQWAYKTKPIYGWVKDTKPGDRTGDGVGNAWRLAKP